MQFYFIFIFISLFFFCTAFLPTMCKLGTTAYMCGAMAEGLHFSRTPCSLLPFEFRYSVSLHVPVYLLFRRSAGWANFHVAASFSFLSHIYNLFQPMFILFITTHFTLLHIKMEVDASAGGATFSRLERERELSLPQIESSLWN